MAFTIEEITKFSIAVKGRTIEDHQGDEDTNEDVAVEQEVGGETTGLASILVANGAAATLWSSSHAVGDFDHAWLVSDQELWVKFASAAGGQAFKIRANQPYKRNSDAAANSYAAGVLAAEPTAEVVTSISVWNASGQEANVRFCVTT